MGAIMKLSRRHLLKGSLAAPLVLTVRPASATAITSATACLDRCKTKAQETKPPKMSDTMHSDEWMRCEVEVCRLSSSVGKPFYDGKYFLGFDKVTYWRLDDRNPYYYPAQPSNYSKGSCYAEKTGQKMYGICYFDQTGEMRGFAWDNQWGGSPASWSCYTSAVGLKQV
jgi:hypothetical protein